jgi:hypothetical protein
MLAIPKQTAFMREQEKPTASVVVTMHPGRFLDPQQVGAITNLVGSSVPNLGPANVTIVDSEGSLLAPNAQRLAGLDSTQQNNLSLIVFSSIYISSWNGTGFQANNNNFIGLSIQNNWGPSPYFNNKFFCSSDNQPFASFNSVDNNITFLVERWKLRMQFPQLFSQTLVVNEKDIAKFWIINFDANSTNRESIYNSYPANDLSTLESKIANAISIYKTATGQLIQSAPPIPPQLLSITKTVIGDLKFIITVNDSTGNKWNMIIAEYKVESPSECADNDYNNITNLISNDKQSLSIFLEDIQSDSDCENTSVASVKFRITLNPVLSDGVTLDQTRSQNSQVIIGDF